MYPFYYNPYAPAYYPSGQEYYVPDPSQMFDYYANAVQQMPIEEIKKPDEVNTAHSITAEKPVKEEPPASPKPVALPLEEKEKPEEVLLEHKSEEMVAIKKALPKKKSKNTKGKHIQTLGSRPRYVHKNFESNMVNKIFFFLWTEDKSARYVKRMLGADERVSMYYQYIKVVRKYCKRYINKEYLLDLCNYRQEHIAYRIVAKKVDEAVLTMTDFSNVMKRLIGVYLRGESINSVLTSKKMKSCSWKDHFEKARTIQRYLFESLSPRNYDYQIIESYTELHQLLGQDSQ